jgi:hypothetical protein
MSSRFSSEPVSPSRTGQHTVAIRQNGGGKASSAMHLQGGSTRHGGSSTSQGIHSARLAIKEGRLKRLTLVRILTTCRSDPEWQGLPCRPRSCSRGSTSPTRVFRAGRESGRRSWFSLQNFRQTVRTLCTVSVNSAQQKLNVSSVSEYQYKSKSMYAEAGRNCRESVAGAVS